MDKNIFDNGIQTIQNLKFKDEIIKFESQLVNYKLETLIKNWISLINKIRCLIKKLISFRRFRNIKIEI